MKNELYKLMASMPFVLLNLYCFPFLGIFLALFRFFYYKNKCYKTSLFFVLLGLLLIIPNWSTFFLKMCNFPESWVSTLNIFISSELYLKIFDYGKFLIYLGIIFLILKYVFFEFFYKIKKQLSSKVEKYIKDDLNKDYEIRKENDLKMHEKREIAKNTHVVKCPYCGSDNVLTQQIGICGYCRRNIEYKNEKNKS